MPRPPPPTTTSDPASPTLPTERQFLRQDSHTSSFNIAANELRRASMSVMDADMPVGVLAVTGELLARSGSSFSMGGRRRSRAGSKVESPSPLATEISERPNSQFGLNGFDYEPNKDDGLEFNGSTLRTIDSGIPQHHRFPNENLLAHLNKVHTNTSQPPTRTPTPGTPPLTNIPLHDTPIPLKPSSTSSSSTTTPPSHTQTFLHTLRSFLSTPTGLFATIYLLLVIAWGGFLFLILINAAPRFTGEHRLIWIEIASQVVNALFTLTGFGLAPWRFRDLYWLIRAKYYADANAWNRICAKNVAWFRPDGRLKENGTVENDGRRYDMWDEEVGTKRWKLWTVVGLYVANTFLQVGLSSLMWGMTRHNRPAGAVGALVALACCAAGGAGGMVWWEGRRLKKSAEKEAEEEESGGEEKV